MNTLKKTYSSANFSDIRLILGDITQEPADIIVNAANSSLQHGGGVAAAIAKAGGPEIQKESDLWIARHGQAAHNNPAITNAGKLPARYIIHAVGPIWGSGDEEEKLRVSLRAVLATASKLKASTIALPALSCGIYQFPPPLAAEIFSQVLFTKDEICASHDMLVKMVLTQQALLDTFMRAFNLAAEKP